MEKIILLMKIINIILVLHTRIILFSSFVRYIFCICHSGSFPIMSYIVIARIYLDLYEYVIVYKSCYSQYIVIVLLNTLTNFPNLKQ